MLKFQWNHLAITFIRWRCRSFCEITTATHNHLNNICVLVGWWLNQLACMEFLAVSSSFCFHFIASSTDARTDNNQQRWRNAQSINKHLDNCIEKLDTLTKYQQHCNWYANPESLSTCFPDQWPPPAAATFHFISILRNTITRKSVCPSTPTPHTLRFYLNNHQVN